MADPDVLIVGAGLAGLCCAGELHRRGVPFLMLDAADQPGGRVRTDQRRGFLLDRGFQVLLSSYPSARALLDYRRLDLRSFAAGALVRTGGEFHRLGDPWRQPLSVFSTATAPVGTLRDKLRIAQLRRELLRSTDLFTRPESTTEDDLKRRGFSPAIIERFFRPFFGGVFLDSTLSVSSRMFEFVFQMMSSGSATLPAKGMQAIPDQLAEHLPAGSLRLNTRVARLDGKRAILESGEEIDAETVVVATDTWNAARLLGDDVPRAARGTVCLYFDAPEPPIDSRLLVLNGEGHGLINTLCVPSNVSPAYAPKGRALVSVTLLDCPTAGQAELFSAVRGELAAWFGSMVASWQNLALYRIPHALPVMPAIAAQPACDLQPGLFVCGDYLTTPSIQGAMETGCHAAQRILAAPPVPLE